MPTNIKTVIIENTVRISGIGLPQTDFFLQIIEMSQGSI